MKNLLLKVAVVITFFCFLFIGKLSAQESPKLPTTKATTVNAITQYTGLRFLPNAAPYGNPGGCYGRRSNDMTVTFSGFADTATIKDATDIVSFCMNIEHAMVGNLAIALICPNGQKAVLKYYSGAGCDTIPEVIANGYSDPGNCVDYGKNLTGLTVRQVGEPVFLSDPSSKYCDSTLPRNMPNGGDLFCFSEKYSAPDQTQGYMNNNIGAETRKPATDIVNQKNYYMPNQSFSTLVGCPLNGEWTLRICDYHLDATKRNANGYLHSWALELSERAKATHQLASNEFCKSSTALTDTSSNIDALHTTFGKNVCYTFTPSKEGYYMVSNYGRTNYNTRVLICPEKVYDNNTCIAVNDNGRKATFYAQANKTYYINWYNFDGEYDYQWSLLPTRANTVKAVTQYTGLRFLPNAAPNGNPAGCYERRCNDMTVAFSGFADTATIKDATDIVSFRMNIEHAMVGNLAIALICPNGQKTVLKYYSGAGCNTIQEVIANGYSDPGNCVDYGSSLTSLGYRQVGEPVYTGESSAKYCDSTLPRHLPNGGELYCFSEKYNATEQTYGFMNDHIGTEARKPATDTLNYKNYYLPNQSFSTLIGCPLNGEWTLRICDYHLNASNRNANGYLHSWSLELSESAKSAWVPIALDKKSATIEIEKNIQLSAALKPNGDGINNIVWESSNPAIATVNETGLVTAVTQGTTYIVATINDGSNLKDSCLVTVLDVSGIEAINTNTTTLKVYPNPVVNGKLTISPLAPKGGIKVYDMQGKLVAVYSRPLVEVGGAATFDISNLPKGNYMIKVGNETVKIVVN